ncbi:MAG TPA: HAD-IA family hydrolase, partial [Candidatus Dormibacteraeota bacterium]|nr:HAD-IA family hydrolase [Candidatus Dormibacteraeota bacterium]
AQHIRTVGGVGLPERNIIAGVVALLTARYRERLPLIEGAREAVLGLARCYRLGLASSAPAEVIRFVLHAAGLAGVFTAWLSSDDVARGKPAPDAYLGICDRLRTEPRAAVAVEDSTNGLLAARNAGLAVIAAPNPGYPPAAEGLEVADLVVGSIADLTPDVVASLDHE